MNGELGGLLTFLGAIFAVITIYRDIFKPSSVTLATLLQSDKAVKDWVKVELFSETMSKPGAMKA